MLKDFDSTKYTPDLSYQNEGTGVDGALETYSPDIDTVLEIHKKTPRKLWTICEVDDGSLHIHAGLSVVNRFLYFISNELWDSAEETYLWCGPSHE